MILLELFNSNVKWHLDKNSDTSWVASAKIGGRTIHFTAILDDYEEPVPYWEVVFTESNQKIDHYADKTGSGKELEVFKMVMSCLKDFIAEKKPEIIKFSSEEKNRTSLYTALVKRYMPSNYKMTVKNVGGIDVFRLTTTK